jgi:GxxExxY protein
MKSMEGIISRKGAEAQSKENKIGSAIVDASIEVHRFLGPGLLESVYESALAHELALRGLTVACQVPIDVTYKGIRFEHGFRADLIIENLVVVELKSVEQISAAHRKQLQTYLRLSDLKLGFLLNFGAPLMKSGIVRTVNGLEESSTLGVSASLRESLSFISNEQIPS